VVAHLALDDPSLKDVGLGTDRVGQLEVTDEDLAI
jgi:hypothetical protein